MEKEKPFKCDVCGKRYKNLNGLKYVRDTFQSAPSVLADQFDQHKQHSPMCDPDMRLHHQTLLNSMIANPAALLALQQNLPSVNEEFQ